MFLSAFIGVHPSAVLRTVSAVERRLIVGGRNVQNEPNSSIADCRFRIADWAQTCGGATNRAKRTQFGWSAGVSEGEMRKTNPICPAERPPTVWAGRTVQNEPNSLQRRVGRDPRGVGRGGKLCKTNPISPTGTRGECAKQTQFRRAQPRGGADRAKQSQTWAAWDIWVTARQGGRLCKTKPICRVVGRGPRRLWCETKPICRGHPGMGAGGLEGPPEDLLCKTKPICGLQADARERSSATVCPAAPDIGRSSYCSSPVRSVN
jgi:hypothetical protein